MVLCRTDSRLSDKIFVTTLNVRSTDEFEPEILMIRLANLQTFGDNCIR